MRTLLEERRRHLLTVNTTVSSIPRPRLAAPVDALNTLSISTANAIQKCVSCADQDLFDMDLYATNILQVWICLDVSAFTQKNS